MALTLIHLISIPITNTSVNPARSTGPALLGSGEYVVQLWLFGVAPVAEAMLAGTLGRMLYEPTVAVDTAVIEDRRPCKGWARDCAGSAPGSGC